MYAWLWSFLRRDFAAIAIGLLLALLATALNVVPPWVSGRIVDEVILGGRSAILGPLVLAFTASVALKVAIRFGFQMIFERASQRLVRALRGDLYARLHRLDRSFFDRSDTGSIMAQLTGDLDAIRHFAAWVIYTAFENLTLFLCAIAVLSLVEWRLTLALLALAPLVAWTTLAFARVVKPAFGEVRERFSSLNSRVQQNIAGSRVVRAFRGEARERELFETENRAFGEANLAATAAWARFLPALELISGALGLVAIVGGGWMVIAGKLTMGDLIVFNGMVWMFNNPMRMAPGIVNNIEQFRASLEKVHRIVAEEPRVAESPGARDPGPFRDSLEFHGVSFSYGDGLALDGVDFRLPRGGKLGIVGPTGSGKSTIASLILREYDPSSGAVLADGRDLRELPLASLHRLAGCAMQEVFLFSDSVAANIAFARPAASRAEIERAARLAEAEEFILGLEEGYDTVIGERGVGLSGGQRQRLALARLLLADPDILVLDDTTSAVDIGTERRINAALARLRGEKTIVVVGHRLSSVRDAGLILVMDRGRVAEQGNHAELVAAGGWYSRVWERQRGSVAAAMEGSVDGP